MERRSVIFTPHLTSDIKLECKLRAINPYFHIVRNLKLSIPERYWFNGAYRVYDPYNDEDRFLRTINNFARVCKLEKYFFIDDNENIWEIVPEANTKIPIADLKIICDEAHEVGHMMPIMLGSVVNACPELKQIIDIGKEK